MKPIECEFFRSDVYRLLALGLDTPSESNLGKIESLLTDLSSCSVALPEGLGDLQKFLYEERSLLQEGYNRLFVTRTECPASEGSYHLAERGPVLGDVAAFYEAFRVKISPESGPPDAMKMELAFMHSLALKKAYALENDLAEAFEITEGAEKAFLRDHLGRWAERFAARICDRSSLSFYRAMASILSEWIAQECRRFEIAPVPLPIALPWLDEQNATRCGL